MIDISLQTILEMLSQIIGIEGAEKIINDAIKKAGLPKQPFYSEPDFRNICDQLKLHGGSVKMFASLIQTPKYRESQYQRIIDKEKKEKEELGELYKKMEHLNSELHKSNEKFKRANISMQKMQEELLRKEKLATIGQLAATIAHELRNPLTTIKNAKYYLMKFIKTEDPKVKEILTLISSEIDRTNRIVTELMEFSQEKEYFKLDADINQLIEETVKNIETGSITIVNEFDRKIPFIKLDQDKIKQVIINLATNAADAMANKGLLTITTSVNYDYSPGTKYASISFSDTGCGMNKETMGRIFEPLFTTKLKGIGLGLSIVRDIINKHGGHILVKSEESNGSTFTILLPLDA